jgi:hypothetical protein
MIIEIFTKLIGRIMEKNNNKWVDEKDKRAIGQDGFRPKQTTIDHSLTLSHTIKKIDNTKYE